MKSLFFALAVASFAGSIAFESQAAEAPPPGRPNVLFITCDDLNNALGVYGHPQVKSPRIDALAASGARFERAFSNWPSCLPSRYSLLSGWDIPRTGLRDFSAHSRSGPLADAVYLPQYYKNQGYTTVRLDKIFHIGGDDPASWTISEEPLQLMDGTPITTWTGIELQALGYDGVHQKPIAADGTLGNPVIETGRFPKVEGEKGTYFIVHDGVPEERLFDGHTAKRAIGYLERFAASREPFFLAVGFRRPHLPFIAHQRYFDLYPWEQIELPPAQPGYEKPFSDEDHKKLIRGYYASISFVDAQVGKVLDTLERTGLAENTIVVLLGDHGYALGERDGWFSKATLWDTGLQTTLIVADPRRRDRARAVPEVVSLLDLYPTLVDLTGMPAPATPLDGRSLLPLIDGVLASDPARPGHALAHNFRPGWKELGVSVRTPTHRYIENGDGTIELYDVVADPFLWRNLAEDPAHAALREQLSLLLRPSATPATTAGSADEPLL
jgi:uncharacterized sulfatase